MDVSDAARAGAVMIVAAGVEQDATSTLQEVTAITTAPVVVIGAAMEHPLIISLVRAGAHDYFALPADVERLGAWLDEVVRRQNAHADAASSEERRVSDGCTP